MASAELVARELLELGHRSLAAMFGPQSTSTGRDRENGFRAVLAESSLELAPERWRRTPFDFDAGRRLTLELRPIPRRSSARTTSSRSCPRRDQLARAAHPDDITLIGLDDVLLARWQVFQLTTVSQDIGQMVQVCTELLLSRGLPVRACVTLSMVAPVDLELADDYGGKVDPAGAQLAEGQGLLARAS